MFDFGEGIASVVGRKWINLPNGFIIQWLIELTTRLNKYPPELQHSHWKVTETHQESSLSTTIFQGRSV